jgi:hypothetical protein
MVKYAMGHANYQELMMEETIVGIALLEVYPLLLMVTRSAYK